MSDLKKYLYVRGADEALDQEFKQAIVKGKVKLGETAIFWKQGLRWHVVKTDLVERAYRRVEEVNSRVCCGSICFPIQKLELRLKNGEELSLLIAEGDTKMAESLYKMIKEKHPQLQYGKV